MCKYFFSHCFAIVRFVSCDKCRVSWVFFWVFRTEKLSLKILQEEGRCRSRRSDFDSWLESKEEHSLYFGNSSSFSLRSGDLETTAISLNSGPFAPPAVPALFIDYLVQLTQQRPPRAPTVAGTVHKEAGRRCFFFSPHSASQFSASDSSRVDAKR